MPHAVSLHPTKAIEGGRVTISGSDLTTDGTPVDVHVGGHKARVVFAAPDRITFLVPSGIEASGPVAVRVGGGDGTRGGSEVSIQIAAMVATGLHQVDSPVVDADNNLYLTYSGTRGQEVPVSIFRVGANGTRETYSAGIVNPTSMAFDAEGRLYVSSRFEGVVYRVNGDGTSESFATDLGITCGLAFGPDGTLYAGDRSGTIFAVDQSGHSTRFATLPPSVAAFHLALRDDGIFVSAPTLTTYDPVYHVTFDGRVERYSPTFGRPQGLAIGPDGSLYVVEALAGASGVYRLAGRDVAPELILSGPGLVGVAFDRKGALIVCTGETAYRLA
jgi:uncharacterized protein (TIGR03437 family)